MAVSLDSPPCPGCGDTHPGQVLLHGRDRLLLGPGDFRVESCPNCRLAYTAPRLAPEDFATYYPREYTSYAPDGGSKKGRVRGAFGRLRMELITRRGPYRRVFAEQPGRLLDVGCGRGDLAATFARHGWTVSGVEPSAETAAVAARQGVDVHVGTLEDAPWAPGTFDAIVFNHSLEHIPQPEAAIRLAAALLRPGGLLAVAVPNFRSWQARVFGPHWFQLDLPRHLQHFDRTTLPELMRRSGLQVEDVSAASMRPGLLSSVQYRLFGHRRFSGKGFRLAVWATSPFLLVSDAVSEGDCLHVVARAPGKPA